MIFRSTYQRLFSAVAGLGLTGTLAALAAVAPSEITLISRPSGTIPGVQANGRSLGPVSLSGNGQLVAFSSYGRNLYALDTNSVADIFIRDRSSNFTSIVSLGNPAGGSSSTTNNRVAANGDSRNPSLSPTSGRFVAFESAASNLVTGDSNDQTDIFVRDRFGDVVRASVTAFGGQAQAGQGSFAPSISDPQQDPNSGGSVIYVAYHSAANNLDGAESPDNGAADVFVTEVGPGLFFGSLQVNNTRRISVDPNGAPGNGASRNASISADGRYVVFESKASNLVADDGSNNSDIFLADLQSDTIEIISAERDDQGSVVNNSDGDSFLPSISSDGRFIAYVSDSTIFDANDGNGFFDVFVYDRLLNTTDRVSVNSFGEDADDDSILLTAGAADLSFRPTVTENGRFVTFVSRAENLDDTDGNALADVFIHDRQDGETRRLSVSSSLQENGDSTGAAISANGSVIAFASTATNLISDDNNLQSDIFAVETGADGTSAEGQPTADAGADELAFELDTVFLDGTASSDPEDDALTYQWSQVEDPDVPTIVLSGADTATPSFQAPLVEGATLFTFQLIVSDGVNTSEPAFVSVFVDEAPAATLSGKVTDANGQPVVGADISIVRTDGLEADPVQTDGAGNYEVPAVRVGPNTITVSASGFEPVQRTIVLGPAEADTENFVLADLTGGILGEVRASNGTPVAGALVTLYDNQGEILAEAETDDAGEYFLDDLDRFELAAGGALVVEADGLATWSTSSYPRVEGQLNVQNFRYGRLDVTADIKPTKLRKQLKGAVVTVKEGTRTLGSVTVGSSRRAVFNNIPAVQVRVQVSKPGLGGAGTNVTVLQGRTTKLTVRINQSSGF